MAHNHKRRNHSKGIKVSPQHGVNPSLAKCFFCREDKGLVMLGKLPNDAKAPKKCIGDYQPCDKCAEHWKQGTPIIRCTTAPIYGRLSIVGGLWPTGAWCVISNESAEKIFNDKERIGKPRLLEDKVYDDLFGDVPIPPQKRPQDKEEPNGNE